MNDPSPLAHLIYLRDGRVLVSRKPYADWREIRDEYEDYMTSVGPLTAEGLIEFLSEEYGEESRRGLTAREIRDFMNSSAFILESR